MQHHSKIWKNMERSESSMVFQTVQPRGGAKDLAQIDPAPRLAEDILQAIQQQFVTAWTLLQRGSRFRFQDGPKALWDPIPREDGQPSCELPACASICQHWKSEFVEILRGIVLLHHMDSYHMVYRCIWHI